MQLPYHDRYAYSPIIDRADYSWPDGKRLAVYLGLNIEHFAFGAGEGHLLTVAGAAPDARTFAWRDYGNKRLAFARRSHAALAHFTTARVNMVNDGELQLAAGSPMLGL